jgi:hypothetical protein
MAFKKHIKKIMRMIKRSIFRTRRRSARWSMASILIGAFPTTPGWYSSAWSESMGDDLDPSWVFMSMFEADKLGEW